MSFKHLLVFLSLCLLAPASVYPKDAPPGTDTQAYLEVLNTVKGQSLDQQIEGWRGFLAKHPNSQFRPEIEQNLQNLEELLLSSDPVRKKEARDTEIYLRAVDFSKKLSRRDQVDLWYQFLEENPDNLFRTEVEGMLRELEGGAGPSRPRPPTTQTQISPSATTRAPVVLDLDYKDENRALLYATFAGLIVPGMGHWYAEDYLIAGLLTALRVAALAVGIPAIINNDQPLMITGGVLYGFSYLVDVADTPFAVRRFNDHLEQSQAARFSQPDSLLSFAF